MTPYIKTELTLNEGKVLSFVEKIEASVVVELKDALGNIKFTFKKPMDSFVSNFVQLIGHVLGVNSSVSLKNTQGNTVNASGGTLDIVELNTTSFSSSFGIRFGDTTGRSPNLSINGLIDPHNVQYSDFNLNKRFNSSDIKYTNTVVSLLDASTLVISRSLINDSASSCYVNEIGIVANYVTSTTHRILLARDFLTNSIEDPIEVASGNLLTIRYEIKSSSNNSFTNNFIASLQGLLTKGRASLVNTTGTTAGVDFSSDIYRVLDVMAPNGDSNYGLILNGRRGGVNPDITPTSFKLPDPIDNTLLVHYDVTGSITQSSVKVNRIYERPESSSQTIMLTNAVGVYVQNRANTFLIAGTKLTGNMFQSIPIKPLQLLKVSYEFNFPAVRDKLR